MAEANARRKALEEAAAARKHVVQRGTIGFTYKSTPPSGPAPPIGECLACGHIHALAVWKDAPFSEVGSGLCGGCRDAAVHLRGSCSTERGCLCDQVVTVFRCDRCGKEMAPPVDRGNGPVEGTRVVADFAGDSYRDLCDDCLQALRDWFTTVAPVAEEER